jgi:hypothetical protein
MLKIIPTQEAIDFHYKEVSKIFDKIIEDKYIERGKNKIYLNNCFLRFLINNFEDLIQAKPERLLEIHQEFSKISFSEEEYKLIKSFFIQTGYGIFPNKEFLNHLNIDTCVYCNRNYTLQFDLETNHARAQLDHWFPKKSFPILALSFYNLIPSCSSCNHIKGAAKGYDWLKALDNLKHPYCDKIDFSFSYNFEDYNKPRAIVKAKDKKSENTLNFNKTKEIYEVQSSKELKDLCDLRLKYSKNYLDIMCNKTFEGLYLSQVESYRMIFGIEIVEENYHKRPFSKFKKDIIDELLKIK